MDNPAIYWCFTEFDLENDPKQWDDHVTWCKWSVEKCETSGRLHYQGVLRLNKKNRLAFMKKNLSKTAHWEVTKSVAASQKYVQKENTHVEGPFEYGEQQHQGERTDVRKLVEGIRAGRTYQAMAKENPSYYDERYAKIAKRCKDHLDAEVAEEALAVKFQQPLRQWQIEAVNLLMIQPDRQVLWIVDHEGNSGKTFLSQYLEYVLKYQVLSGGKHADIAYALDCGAAGYAFDFCREEGEDRTPYKILEKIKDRLVPSMKYESVMKRLVNNRLICFANFGPEKMKMSLDRWKVCEVVRHLQTKEYYLKELDGYN